MESTAAFASPEAANKAREREAQNTTQNRNLTGLSSNDGNISSSSVGSRNPCEEDLVSAKGAEEKIQ